MNKKKRHNFYTMLQEFMNLMELPEFQEVDRRLSKLQSKHNNEINGDNQKILTTEQFILILLSNLDFVSNESYMRIRHTLYEALPKIKELIDKYSLTKQKLINVLRHNTIKHNLSYFRYESGEDFLVYQLLDSMDLILMSLENHK